MSMKKVIKTQEEWQEQLTPEQFEVSRNKGTERAFTGEYNDCKVEGIYRCIGCGQELFNSQTKFDSGSGWPSFYAPSGDEHIKTETDVSHGMSRTEVMCSACDGHLGHVFPDGPTPTGLRYCINSVSIKLDKTD
ncbi:MAG: peptide-methionine (R)-S-oxide reductase [Gammaproteobacteria bacterium]|jgi:peptide-methionine (R)-S-oxide reductase